MADDSKFTKEDLPKILAALHQARISNAKSLVEIRFDASGGVTSIDVEVRKKIK